MTTRFDDDLDDPEFPPDDPLAVILRPASEHLAPPPGRYESIRRTASRRRVLRTAAGFGATCAVAALIAVPLYLARPDGTPTHTPPLAPPPASSRTTPSPTPPPAPTPSAPPTGSVLPTPGETPTPTAPAEPAVSSTATRDGAEETRTPSASVPTVTPSTAPTSDVTAPETRTARPQAGGG